MGCVYVCELLIVLLFFDVLIENKKGIQTVYQFIDCVAKVCDCIFVYHNSFCSSRITISNVDKYNNNKNDLAMMSNYSEYSAYCDKIIIKDADIRSKKATTTYTHIKKRKKKEDAIRTYENIIKQIFFPFKLRLRNSNITLVLIQCIISRNLIGISAIFTE